MLQFTESPLVSRQAVFILFHLLKSLQKQGNLLKYEILIYCTFQTKTHKLTSLRWRLIFVASCWSSP